jgi:hypothetical protein
MRLIPVPITAEIHPDGMPYPVEITWEERKRPVKVVAMRALNARKGMDRGASGYWYRCSALGRTIVLTFNAETHIWQLEVPDGVSQRADMTYE